MSLLSTLAPVAGDLQLVDALIRTRLDSDVALVRQVAQYLVSAGGKRCGRRCTCSPAARSATAARTATSSPR